MGKFSAFKLPLKSLGTGTHNFEYHLDKQFFTNMENSDIHGADLDVKLTVVYNGEFYTLDFSIAGEVTLICDRCLDDLHFPIEATYHIVVKYGEDYNDDNDEVLEIPAGDAFLNVAYMIYDTVVLAIPIKHVHPLGKCNRQMSAMLKNTGPPQTAKIPNSKTSSSKRWTRWKTPNPLRRPPTPAGTPCASSAPPTTKNKK